VDYKESTCRGVCWRNLTIIGIETIVAVALAFFTAGIVVRLGRYLPGRWLEFAYLASALAAGVVGMMADWAVNRWRRLPVDQQDWGNFPVGIADAWRVASRPEFGEQWIPMALTASIGLGFATACSGRSRTIVGAALGWVVAFPLLGVLMYRVLVSSVYFLPPETFWSQAAYVLLPAAALSLSWIGDGLAAGRRKVDLLQASGSPSEIPSTSGIYLLALLAVSLSATLLLATSGTLSLATKSLVFAVVPVAWMIELWVPGWGWRQGSSAPLPLQLSSTLVAWLPPTAGLLVVLGHFFAEVPAGLAGLWAVSLGLLPWFEPNRSATALSRWGGTLLAAGPALVAAGISAGIMVAQNG
jgi:hypothetical protein